MSEKLHASEMQEHEVIRAAFHTSRPADRACKLHHALATGLPTPLPYGSKYKQSASARPAAADGQAPDGRYRRPRASCAVVLGGSARHTTQAHMTRRS